MKTTTPSGPQAPDDPNRSVRALRGRVVTPDEIIDDGLVLIEGAVIAWVGPVASAPAAHVGSVPARTEPVRTLLPGLVDLHNHGGGGVGFPDATDVAAARLAVAEHLAHGTTTLVASLVTAPADILVRQTALLADLADAGEIAGIHLEGPFLSRARCGAQDPADMVAGDVALVDRLVEAGRGHLVSMTLAPECPGVVVASGGDDARPSRSVIDALVAAGAVPSFGHTDASAEQTEAALAAARGALASDPSARSLRPTVTHLFNAMRPMHHRDPGPVGAFLAAGARGEVVVELVGDGVHLAEATVRGVVDIVGADGIVLVTDAMAAAGMPDGSFELGSVAVRVAGGVARLAEGHSIAGGTSHLLDVVRHVVGAGVGLCEAVRSASLVPAGVLGRDDVGALETGRRADVVVTDAALRPVAVVRAGQRVV